MRRILIGLAIGGMASLAAWVLSRTTIAQTTEAASYDFRLTRTATVAPPATPIVVVEINEPSVRALEPLFGRWPWPRVAHAVLIDFLAQAGAKVIAYDVLFTEHDTRGAFELEGETLTGGASDAMLAQAAAAAKNVIFLSNAVYEGLASPDQTTGTPTSLDCNAPPLPGTIYAPGPGFMPRPCLDLPFPQLAGAAAGVGHNFTVVEPIAQRKIDPFIEAPGGPVPALGLAAALFALGARAEDVTVDTSARVLRVKGRAVPLHVEVSGAGTDGGPRSALKTLLWFHRPTTTDAGTVTYPSYSFFDVFLSSYRLQQGLQPAVDPAVFKDKVVFVGTTAPGLYDVVRTPFAGNGVGGVHLHATLADNVLSGRFMRRAPAASEGLLLAGVGITVGLVATLVPVAWAAPAVLVGMVLLGAALTAAMASGLWIAAVPSMSASAIALFGGVAWQYFVEDRAKREVRRLFGRFVSKDVIAQLESHPERAALGGQRRHMSVLFSDIRGFTAASEQGTPEDVVIQLNEYFTAMVEVLFRHKGTLDKFVGDMVMGLFGAPLDDPRHADHAVACAREMRIRLAELNAAWTAQGRPAVDIGIGINTGEMIAGNIGSEAIMSYTVIGDAVNLASRLESLNKEHGTGILISEATRAALTTTVNTRLIGEVKVKGKSQAVVVHEVL